MSSAHKALRGVRKTIAKQVKGRFACKFRFTLTYEYVDLQCTNKLKPSNVTVLWFRSHRSKTSKKPEVKACYLDPKTGFFMYNASWSPPNTVELVVTLYKDSTGNFKKKDYFFVIETHIPDADRKKLALFSCNMADFAAPDTNEFDLEMEFKPQSKKVVLAKLGAKIKCEFIKQGSAYDDDMESNFSHMSDTEFKQRINDLTECSDDEDDDKQNNYSKKQNTRQSWTKFVDEMKTLEYQEYHIAMVGNPLAESLESAPELPQNTDQKEAEPEQEDDAPSSPLPVTTSKTRVKKTRVLSALIEEEEKEEEEESPTSPLTEEKQTTQDEEIKFVFPDRKLTRAETLPDIHLAAGNGIIQESHRIKEWMNDVNYKKQEVVISDLKGENQELREGNKVLGNEILELHKEQDDLHTEINELQMLVEDLRTKVSELESKEKKTQTEKRKDNSKNDSSGTNTLPQNKKATQVRGWLCKRGVKGLTGRVWRRRWFATDQQRRLYYYKKTNNTQPRGFIDLDIIIAVQDKPSEEQDINNALFDVIVPGRVFELMAHDEEEKIRWINALDYLRHWRTRMINKEGFGNTSYDI